MDSTPELVQLYMFAAAAVMATSVLVHVLARIGLGRATPGTPHERHATFATAFGIVTTATHFFDVHTSLLMGPIAIAYGVAYLLHARFQRNQDSWS